MDVLRGSRFTYGEHYHHKGGAERGREGVLSVHPVAVFWKTEERVDAHVDEVVVDVEEDLLHAGAMVSDSLLDGIEFALP